MVETGHSPPLTEPSAFMLSQRSQMVVVPIVIGYIQDGQPFSRSIRYASCAYPARVRACVIIGVPTKPVDTRKFASRTRYARRLPASVFCFSEPRRENIRARLRAVWVSPTIRPEGAIFLLEYLFQA